MLFVTCLCRAGDEAYTAIQNDIGRIIQIILIQNYMIQAFVTAISASNGDFNFRFFIRNADLSMYGVYQLQYDPTLIVSSAQLRADMPGLINTFCTANSLVIPDEVIWLIDLPATGGVVKQKFFKANVSGGAGQVTFYTDTNGDGTGTALYSGLTSDMLSFFVDGVSDQYAFPTITVASNKKSVTVTAVRQNFSSGNVLLNLLGAVTNVLTGVTYVNAANGIGVKMIIGIDD